LQTQPLDNGIYRYAFSNFDKIDGIVKGGSRIGFALHWKLTSFVLSDFC